MKPLLSIKEASALVGLSVPTLYKYVFLRTVPYIKVGTRVLFDEDRLAAWVNDHKHEPIPASA